MILNNSNVNKTKNFDLFKFADFNRDVDKGLVELLIKSIQENNLLRYRPIDINSKMEVIDGQHRLLAAKALNIDIYYRVLDEIEDETVICLNNASKNWGADDYIKFYSAKGVKAYQELRKAMKDWNLSATTVVSLLGLTDRTRVNLRNGKLIFNTKEVTEAYEFYKRVINLVVCYRPSTERAFLKSKYFCKALSGFTKLDGVDKETLLDKIELKMNFLRSCSNAKDYLLMFQEIYNFRNRRPVELSFNKLGKLDQYDYENV